MSEILKSSVTTPIGPFSFAVKDGKVIESTFGSIAKLKSSGRKVGSIPMITALVRSYFRGELKALDRIPVDVDASPFRKRVLLKMRGIKVGSVMSYRDLARLSGSEGAARAVGSTCATNRIPLIIPCHRVITSDGSIGNYGYGMKKKSWLLEFEGAIERS